MRVLKEDKNKIAVLGWGRFNPPTIGHQLLGQVVKDTASKVGGTPMIYSSHTYRKKKDKNGLWGDPLPYEEKAKWLKKVFGDMFVESDLTILPLILKDIYDKGYNELYFIAGSDRIDEYRKLVDEYNSKPTKSGGILYDFDNLDDNHFIPAGNERDDNAEGVASVSGTGTRKLAYDGDLEGFKKAVPFNDTDAEQMFNAVRTGLGLDESINEDANAFDAERDFTGVKSISDVYNNLVLDGIDSLDLPNEIQAQIKDVLENIKNLTNSLDIQSISKLQTRLDKHGVNLSVSEFINKLKPTPNDISLLVKDNGLELKPGVLDLSTLNYSKNFIDELIECKDAYKDSTTSIGKYEVLIALLFENGTTKTGGKGDVKIGNDPVEVKSVFNDAVIGDEAGTIDLLREFDDFIFYNLENGTKTTKGRTNRYARDFSGETIDISQTKKLKEVVGRDKVSFKELFEKVFEAAMMEYMKQFEYLALCLNYNIDILPKSAVIKELLDSSKYSLGFKQSYQTGGRKFKIKRYRR